MNKVNKFNHLFVFRILLATCYQHCSMSNSNQEHIDEEESGVRCLDKDIPILFWHCFTQSPAHATTVVVIVVIGATVV
jgi:hypothetical protein